MPAKTLDSPLKSSSAVLDEHLVRAVLTQLKTVASSAGFESIKAIHDDNNDLQSQLKSKNDDLASLKNEMNELEKAKEVAMKEMFQANARETKRLEDTQSHVVTLQKTIADKEKCIAQRNKVVDEHGSEIKKLQSENAKERERLADAQKNIRDLKQNIQDKDGTIEKMKSAGRKLADDLASAKKRVRDLEGEAKALNESLAATQGQLAKLEGFAAGYTDMSEEAMIHSFLGLWDFARDEIYSILKNDLPKESLQYLSARNQLPIRDFAEAQHVPLPCSNTVAAKQMRLAIILAILAQEIDMHIFQPIYIAPVTKTYDSFRTVLTNEAITNSEKESFCRSILLSMDVNTQRSICLEGMQTVVANVSKYLDELLPEDQRCAFHNTLTNVVQKAADIWKPIQRTKRRYETDFGPPTDDEDWMPFIFPNGDKTTSEKIGTQKKLKGDSLIIFPRLSVIDKELSAAYTAVILLNSSEPQWIAAQGEMEKEPPSPTLARRLMPFSSRSNSPRGVSFPNGASKKGNGV
ncbi:hypothetical protein BDV26DRAFT_305182 [Aspergillus bertholletiae]|uniref:MEI5 protein n=1 Tax=Aspergillus bertholletiae TaxID=1226010 RepID=A0A5N7B492_9EURO|nr:hypothetical protein BDV26DRAFT_305182 [Aspergillus bertholletiae]